MLSTSERILDRKMLSSSKTSKFFENYAKFDVENLYCVYIKVDAKTTIYLIYC